MSAKKIVIQYEPSTTDFPVESSIPLPAKGYKYPFEKMEVGDSFAVPLSVYKSVAQNAHMHNQGGSKRYTVRKYQDAYRCWRVS